MKLCALRIMFMGMFLPARKGYLCAYRTIFWLYMYLLYTDVCGHCFGISKPTVRTNSVIL